MIGIVIVSTEVRMGKKRSKSKSKAKARTAPVREKRPFEIPAYILVILLFVLTIVAYFPAIQGGWIWDDDSYIYKNETLKTLGGIVRIWFEPSSIRNGFRPGHVGRFTKHVAGYRTRAPSPSSTG